MTTKAFNYEDFRFTITGATVYNGRLAYSVTIEAKIECDFVQVYGTLAMPDNLWCLMDATFENAHSQMVHTLFWNRLMAICSKAFPEAIKYCVGDNSPAMACYNCISR